MEIALLIHKKNKEIARFVIDFLAKNECLIIRISYDDEQLISGDIDIFIDKTTVNEFIGSLKAQFAKNDLKVKVKISLCGYCIYIVDKDWTGFCKLDVHVNEVYKYVTVLPNSQFLNNTYVDNNGLKRASFKNQAWIQYCFYLLNNQVDNPKFLRAYNYLKLNCPEILIHLKPRGISASFSAGARKLLLLKLICKSLLRPIMALRITLRYIDYVIKKTVGPRQIFYFNGNICSVAKVIISAYFRGQPVAFDAPCGKETVLITATSKHQLSNKVIESESSRLLRDFFEQL